MVGLRFKVVADIGNHIKSLYCREENYSMPNTVKVIRDNEHIGYADLITLRFISKFDGDNRYSPEQQNTFQEISIETYNSLKYKRLLSEAPYKRDIQKKFIEWKRRNHRCDKILLVSGPRQVGKTTELLKFAYSNYKTVIYINLASKSLSYQNCFNSFFDNMFDDNEFLKLLAVAGALFYT